MDKIIKLNFALSAKRNVKQTPDVMLYSRDKNNHQFEISVDGLEMDDSYTAEILTKFNFSPETPVLTQAEIVDGKIIYVFNTDLITAYDYATSFLYLKKEDKTADVFSFSFEVSLSELDKSSERIKDAYDIRYENVLTEFETALAQYYEVLPDASVMRTDVDNLMGGLDKLIKDVEVQEAERELAEDSRQGVFEANELARESGEDIRVVAESDRELNEDERTANELDRISEESKRATAEDLRESSEEARDSNETTRTTAESVRDTNETERQLSESVRDSSEEVRVSNETDRNNSEDGRMASEALRDTSESQRVLNEDERISSEQARELNEAERISKDSERDSKIEAVEGRLDITENELSRLDNEKADSVVDEYEPTLLSGYIGGSGGRENIRIYKDSQGFVHVHGRVEGSTLFGDSNPLFNVPMELRPAHIQAGVVCLDPRPTGTGTGVRLMSSNGNCIFTSAPQAWTLINLSYFAGL